MSKELVANVLLAPTPLKGFCSGAMSVLFASAHANEVANVAQAAESVQEALKLTPPEASVVEQIVSGSDTILMLTPSQWTAVAAILTSIWTVLCIVRSFPIVGQKADAFMAWCVVKWRRMTRKESK